MLLWSSAAAAAAAAKPPTTHNPTLTHFWIRLRRVFLLLLLLVFSCLFFSFLVFSSLLILLPFDLSTPVTLEHRRTKLQLCSMPSPSPSPFLSLFLALKEAKSYYAHILQFLFFLQLFFSFCSYPLSLSLSCSPSSPSSPVQFSLQLVSNNHYDIITSNNKLWEKHHIWVSQFLKGYLIPKVNIIQI